MRLLSKRDYSKKAAFRDAKLYIIVCEGEKREPNYFDFFREISSQLRLNIIPSTDGKSAPNHLIERSTVAEGQIESDLGEYELWIVLDTDKWNEHLHKIYDEVKEKKSWYVAISNPCFEIWLYYHFNSKLPNKEQYGTCQKIKELTGSQTSEGFDCSYHPALVETALKNARLNYSETGYIPNYGGTQLISLMEKIYNLTESVIKKYNPT